MTNDRHIHRLTGCTPTPLASYLKALGVLRLIAEQADPSAQGWWSGDQFHLQTKLDGQALKEFFLQTYHPTPLVAPWNGGSGFYPKDNQAAITCLSNGSSSRLAEYRDTISACRSVLSDLGLKEKPDGDSKGQLLIACRARLPDIAITSLDAAYVLTQEGPKYPPLLGTGFNDGRLEFTNNFMQRLLDLIDPETGMPTRRADRWWDEAFFPEVQDSLQKDSILGQFDPGAVEKAVNPWDFLLMLEGALVFAAATVKRLESSAKGALSYPFCVRSAGIGYASSASSDEGTSRAELWLPLWANGCTYSELQSLLSEGRVQVNGRAARNGVDFARAVSTLGIDRGISQFERFGFHARNGLAYFAVPLGRFNVQPQPQVNLLSEIDIWLDSFRRAASSDTAPSRAQRALRRLDTSIFELCHRKSASRLQSVLSALGEVEAVLAIADKWRTEAFQRPVPLLSPKWLVECDDGSDEFQLAVSLAAMYSPFIGDFRQHLEAVELKGRLTDPRPRWADWNELSSALCNVVWTGGTLQNNLIAVLQRRIVEATRHDERSPDETLVFPGRSLFSASLGNVSAFLREDTDDDRIASLVRGLSLLDWGRVSQQRTHEMLHERADQSIPDGTFSILKLCHTPWPVRDKFVRLEPAIVKLGAAGNATAAIQQASRRLNASGLPPAIRVAHRPADTAVRMTAALLFPLKADDVNLLADRVLERQTTPMNAD